MHHTEREMMAQFPVVVERGGQLRWGQSHAMLGALEAILGHKSAHSLATGPFTVEPGLSRERGSLCRKRGSLFGAKIKAHRSIFTALTFHFTFVVDYDTSIVWREREANEVRHVLHAGFT